MTGFRGERERQVCLVVCVVVGGCMVVGCCGGIPRWDSNLDMLSNEQVEQLKINMACL